MSMWVRVAVGHFDGAAIEGRKWATPELTRAVSEDEVARLEEIRDAVFDGRMDQLRERGMGKPLAGHVKDGLLWFGGVSVTPDAYAVSCAARELFGMSAVDVAHGATVCPDMFGIRAARIAREQASPSDASLGDVSDAAPPETESLGSAEQIDRFMQQIEERVHALVSR
jgi:hypothetical protein